jgi:HlyD family secretion protein
MTIVGVVGVLALGFALVRPAGGVGPTTAAAPAATEKASGGGFSFGGGGEGKRVEVLTPRRGPIASSIEAPGTVQAGSEAGCGAPFEGQVAALVHDTGDRVKAGEVLFRLDPDAHQERVVEAEIDLERKRSARDEALVEVETAERKFADAEREPSDLTEARLKVRQSELESQRATAQLESAANKRDRSRQMLAQGIGTPIDLEAAESEHRVTEISVRLADEQLKLARETLSFRERTWLEARATAGKDVTVARARRVRADADLRGAEVALARAKRDLEHTEIRSPIDGVVTDRAVNMGDQVSRAAAGTAHYIVSDLEHVLVYCDVDEGDVSRLAQGQVATARVGALGEELRLTGKVYDVAMRAQTKQGDEVPTFRVRVLLDLGQTRLADLRPGMTATVVIETARLDAALKVPLQAVLQRELRALPDAVKARAPAALVEGKRPFDLIDLVFTVEQGKAQAHVVQRGLQDEDEVALELGAPGDAAQVIVGPFRALEKLEEAEAVKAEPAEVALPEDEGVAAVGSAN